MTAEPVPPDLDDLLARYGRPLIPPAPGFDPETLARPWAIPGTPGLMHRVGGIEKQDVTGNVNYEPANHELMMHLRADKIAGIAKDIPDRKSTRLNSSHMSESRLPSSA